MMVSYWPSDRRSTCSVVSGDGEQHWKEWLLLHIKL